MGYDLRNAAVLACCVLAIVVAAPFFPAAGFGDAPDRDAAWVEHEDEAVPTDGTGDDDGTGGSDAGADDGTGGSDAGADDGTGGSDAGTDGGTGGSDAGADDGTGGSDAGTDGDPSDRSGVLSSVILAGLMIGGALVLWVTTDPRRAGDVSDEEIPEAFVPRLRFRLRRIPQVTMVATIGAARLLPSIADAVGGGVRIVGLTLGSVGRGVGRGVGLALFAIPTGIAAVARVGVPFVPLSDAFTSLFGGLGRRRDRTAPRRTATRRSEPAGDGPRDRERPPATVEEAWSRFVESVPLRRPSVRTPGECARVAIDAGLPADPVSTLTETFREVRYGGASRSPDRIERARDAYERIRRDATDDGGGTR